MKLLDFALKLRARPLLGYGVSLVLFLAGFLLHWSFTELGFPFVTFIPAVMLATLLGGRWPGLMNAVLSGLAAWYFFLPPHRSFALIWPTTHIALSMYVLAVTIIIAVIETMYRALENYRAQQTLTDTMFHELQHRIANNLQFIGSMLSIQRRKIMKDPAQAEALMEEASQRLATMARIHRRLYDPASAGIEFRQLVQEIGRDLISAVGAHNVVCVVDMPPIAWNLDRLITLALLMTEVITNSLKHAFDDKGGRIEIRLSQSAQHQMELTIADNGRGLPADFNPLAAKSLGMQIIQGLVTQIGGKMEIDGVKGTTLKVVLPV
jgi:two-component sensor histidine kinase